jgi:hypothetical protein
MSIEAMKQALDALEGWAGHGKWIYPESALEQAMKNTSEALPVLRAAIQQDEKQEPESFEAWHAKQHGDPEEIGFLQALRIAYYAGQDSVTKIGRDKE